MLRENLPLLSSLSVILPLIGSLFAGLGGGTFGKKASQLVTISLLLIAFICSVCFAADIFTDPSFNGTYIHWYSWITDSAYSVGFGLWIDPLIH